MKPAYVDSSCLVAVMFDEPAAPDVRARLREHALVAASLLETEVRAAVAREGKGDPDEVLSWVEWSYPTRRLTDEIGRVLQAGYLRGPDAWHLATALFVAGDDPSLMPFLTLDADQRTIASALGFPTPL